VNSIEKKFGQVYNTDMLNKGKVKKKRRLIYPFIITVLVLFLIIYVLPTVTGALTQTSLVEYGSIQIVDEVTCYFVREEKVHLANDSGTIQYYFEEGELVRKGTKVLEIVPSRGNYFVEDNGIVSYYVDGLEKTFSPRTMKSLKKDKVENLDIKINHIKRDSVISGEPVYKMIDNTCWYVVFWVKPNNIIKYTKGDTVYLNLPLGKVKGITHDILEQEGRWLVILKFNCYYKDLPKLRKIDTEVITSNYEGLMIANKSITSLDGKPGVYVRDISGEFVFTPVSVITSDGEYSLVESSFYYEKVDGKDMKIPTVNVYDEILNNPERK
jgi:putative membrane fusion protein